jgi:hypothetical protein
MKVENANARHKKIACGNNKFMPVKKTFYKGGLLIFFLLFVEPKCAFRSGIPEGWRMPAGYEHADGWRKENPERFLKVIGDFNGDSEADEARLLLRKKDKALGLFIKNRWSKHNEFFLLEVGDSSLIHSFGIRLFKPGLYVTACGKGYWGCGENEPPEIQLGHDAIDLFKIESANSFFYWDSTINDFKRIWISD